MRTGSSIPPDDWDDDEDQGCQRCFGEGEIEVRIDDVTSEWLVCPECDGSGWEVAS